MSTCYRQTLSHNRFKWPVEEFSEWYGDETKDLTLCLTSTHLHRP